MKKIPKKKISNLHHLKCTLCVFVPAKKFSSSSSFLFSHHQMWFQLRFECFLKEYLISFSTQVVIKTNKHRTKNNKKKKLYRLYHEAFLSTLLIHFIEKSTEKKKKNELKTIDEKTKFERTLFFKRNRMHNSKCIFIGITSRKKTHLSDTEKEEIPV